MSNHNEISSFIWNVCDDVLRGLFKQHEYGDVILPFVVLRRLDCVLEGNKNDILKIHEEYKDKFDDTSKIIHSKLNIKFSNYSQYDFERLKQEPNKLDENIYEYLSSFSSNVQDIIQNFGLQKHIEKLNSNDRLYLLIEKFTTVDLHPDVVDNHTMGQVFEELLRRFSEMSNETSGEHYTPRDVVQLLVSLVFTPDIEELSKPNKIVSVYDPCCGSGHILTYSFDLLTLIYEEQGYSKSEIPTLILENNIYGCDIDKRAATLANFALTMKARLYHRRFFKKSFPVKQ